MLSTSLTRERPCPSSRALEFVPSAEHSRHAQTFVYTYTHKHVDVHKYRDIVACADIRALASVCVVVFVLIAEHNGVLALDI